MKPIIYLLHGMWEKAEIFEPWANNLRLSNYNVRCPQMIFEDDTSKTSIFDCVRRIEEMIYNEPNFQKSMRDIVLIGHSFGAVVARLIATRTKASGRIKSIICLNSASVEKGIIPTSRTAFGVISRNPTYTIDILTEKWVKPNFKDACILLFNQTDKKKAKKLFNNFQAEPGRIIKDVLLHRLISSSQQIDFPILFIGATHDRMTPIWMQKKLANFYGATLIELEGDHMLPFCGNVVEMVDIVDSFISNLDIKDTPTENDLLPF